MVLLVEVLGGLHRGLHAGCDFGAEAILLVGLLGFGRSSCAGLHHPVCDLVLLVQLGGLLRTLDREATHSPRGFAHLVRARRTVGGGHSTADDAETGADCAAEHEEARASAKRRNGGDGFGSTRGIEGGLSAGGRAHTELHSADLVFNRYGGLRATAETPQVLHPRHDLLSMLHELRVILGMIRQCHADGLGQFLLGLLVLRHGAGNVTAAVEIDGLVL
mmetsp:Transcript_79100/g.228744  ORF Transcript_79100/g.228744 Transcript_79100/m.228744 type:complete len:219 (+) Transcript_79100:251-907(+)